MNQEIVQCNTASFNDFLTSLSGVKRKQKDLEVLLHKNKNEQRTIHQKVMKEKEKMTEAARKVKTMELRKAQLQQEYETLVEEHGRVEEI